MAELDENTLRSGPNARLDNNRPTFGLLGVGVDVRAAIALASSRNSPLTLDRDQIPDVCEKIERRFQDCSRRLYDDNTAQKCFHWQSSDPSNHLVELKAHGAPSTNERALKAWLALRTAGLCDIRKEPVDLPLVPSHGPWHDHERWGIWAGCDPRLAAWQELCRAAQIKHILTGEVAVKPTFVVYPSLQCNELNFGYLRRLGVPLLRPRPGHVFVIATLGQLKLRCFAAVCNAKIHSPRGRLEGYFLASFVDPLDAIAAELFAETNGRLKPATSDTAAQADLATTEIHIPTVRGRSEQFDNVRRSAPRVYLHYRSIAQALLELLPLGLPASRIATILQEVHGVGSFLGTDVERLQETVAQNVVYELKDFFHDDSFLRLMKVTGQTSSESALWSEVDPRHIAPIVAKELQDRSRRGRVWDHIREVRRSRGSEDFPTDDQIVDRVLRYRVSTLAGRSVPPTSATGARRAQYLLAVDEVLKVVAYAVAAEGLQLVAVADDALLIEAPAVEATDAFLRGLEGSLRQAQVRLLGELAAPCECKTCLIW
jgi:hypothetical protein